MRSKIDKLKSDTHALIIKEIETYSLVRYNFYKDVGFSYIFANMVFLNFYGNLDEK